MLKRITGPSDYFQAIQEKDRFEEGYLPIPRKMLAYLGSANHAIVLAELISKHNLWEIKGETKELDGLPGWFFETHEDILENTGRFCGREWVIKIIQELKIVGLVKTQNRGVPPKTHFWINYSLIDRILSGREKGGMADIKKTTYSTRKEREELW